MLSKLNRLDFISDTFKEDFSQPGCMYRGPAPRGTLFPLSSAYLSSLHAGRADTVTLTAATYTVRRSADDIKRKEQKYEPYAYVPLDGRNYSRKYRSSTVEQMSTVVRHGAKGKRKRR